ncbi:hypothetical protein WK77_16775 [Burkholderia ubonensis]|nr:hypothetical protein WK77_16775 [Burkholderia ubonensis]
MQDGACADRRPVAIHKTPGTRLQWSTLAEWMDAWSRIGARAASSKRHQQRAAHVAALAANMSVVNCETDVEVLAAAKQIIERENILPPRGMRAGHPATEILQRVGTVLGEQRRAALPRHADVESNMKCWKAAA